MGGDFLNPLVIKSNLINIENLNSKDIVARFHLELLRELLAGYVDNDVIEDLQILVHKLEKKTRRKKKQPPKET